MSASWGGQAAAGFPRWLRWERLREGLVRRRSQGQARAGRVSRRTPAEARSRVLVGIRSRADDPAGQRALVIHALKHGAQLSLMVGPTCDELLQRVIEVGAHAVVAPTAADLGPMREDDVMLSRLMEAGVELVVLSLTLEALPDASLPPPARAFRATPSHQPRPTRPRPPHERAGPRTRARGEAVETVTDCRRSVVCLAMNIVAGPSGDQVSVPVRWCVHATQVEVILPARQVQFERSELHRWLTTGIATPLITGEVSLVRDEDLAVRLVLPAPHASFVVMPELVAQLRSRL